MPKKLNKICEELHKYPNLVRCPKCLLKIGKDWHEKLVEKVDGIPKNVHQKVLDLLKEGRTIGDVCIATGFQTEVVCEIIDRNIGTVHFLNQLAK